MSSIVSGLTSIGEKIANVPIAIVNGISDLLSDLWDWLQDIWGAITGLPQLILDGIKDIFIPDTDYIDNAFNDFLAELKMKFNLDTGVFESLFNDEQAVTDTYMDYDIMGVGTFKFKVFDSKYLVQGVEYFRPIVRGFIVLMLFLYHVRQLISFFGYDSGVVAGRSEHIKSARESQRG